MTWGHSFVWNISPSVVGKKNCSGHSAMVKKSYPGEKGEGFGYSYYNGYSLQFCRLFFINTPFFRYINYPRLYFLNTMLIILFECQDRALQTFIFDKGNSALDKCPRVLTKDHFLLCICEITEEDINIFCLLLSKPDKHVHLMLSNFDHREYILTSFKKLIMAGWMIYFSWMKAYLNIFVGFLTQRIDILAMVILFKV